MSGGMNSEMNGGMNRGRGSRKRNGRTLRILVVLILVLIAAIAASIGYTYKKADESLAVTFTEENPQLEFGEEHKAMDFVADHEGDITVDTKYLAADALGTNQVVFTVSKSLLGGILNPTKEFTLDYSVVDTEDPIILWAYDGAVLQRGEEFDLVNVLSYGDNADPKPAVDIDGEVDMSKNGSYPLHVTVTDSSGNKVSQDLTVNVADSVPPYIDNSPRTQYGDFMAAHKGEGKAFGIDVSEWQGDIDFEAVKKAGCEFVIIRIGYSVDGEVTLDGKFEQNIERARKAGLKTGVYLYSYDNTEDEVRASADFIIEKLGGTELELPVVFDWEDFGSFQSYEMSFTDLNNYYDAFADQLKQGGYDSMLYGSLNYLEKVWTDTDTRPVWLAHYTDKTDYKGPYRIWQASSTGRITGIDADVDMDIMYE